jgi:uncharacterized protein
MVYNCICNEIIICIDEGVRSFDQEIFPSLTVEEFGKVLDSLLSLLFGI